MGGDIVAPDDLVFDDAGNLYLTEITEGRVCCRTPSGEVRVIRGDMPVANPITWHQGRLIAGECRIGARIMELSLDGGAPRVILEDVPMANAFQVGPDGKLYFPVMGTNEIWRVNLDGIGPRGGRGRSRRAGFGQVRCAGADRHDPGRERAGAADRRAVAARAKCWPISGRGWITSLSSAGGLSSRRSPARSPRFSDGGKDPPGRAARAAMAARAGGRQRGRDVRGRWRVRLHAAARWQARTGGDDLLSRLPRLHARDRGGRAPGEWLVATGTRQHCALSAAARAPASSSPTATTS